MSSPSSSIGDHEYSGQNGALPLSDVSQLLESAAKSEKQQALVANIFPNLISAQDDVQVYADLTALQAKITQLVRQFSVDDKNIGGQYIWHREPPTLSIQIGSDSSLSSSTIRKTPPHLRLHLRTGGECVEDEWFVTWILLQATQTPELVPYQIAFSVEDEDGQFLLIESAGTLPKWINPDTAQNRVWLFEGHLHLVPLHHTSPFDPLTQPNDQDNLISEAEALSLVRDTTIITRASEETEQAAFERLSDYPFTAAGHHHRTLAFVSKRVARLLAQDPQSISNAVESLISRDVMSSRANSKMKWFPVPSESDTVPNPLTHATDEDLDIILTPVRMTRYLYAQLSYDRFFPPRNFGKLWQDAVEKYRLRNQSSHKSDSMTTSTLVEDEEQVQKEIRQGRWRDLGAKIWCGLEMAYDTAQTKRAKSRRAGTHIHTNATDASPPVMGKEKHDEFIQSLSKLGYFGQEIQGSSKWKQLEQAAVEQYSNASLHIRTTNSDLTRIDEDTTNLVDKIDAVLTQTSTVPVTVSTESAVPTLDSYEDSEDWMHLNQQDLDELFQSKIGNPLQEEANAENPTSEEEKTFHKLDAFASKLDEFVKLRSDYLGAEFLDELESENDDDLDEDDDLLFEDLDEEEQERKVRATVEKKIKALSERERDERMEKMVPKMTEEEWKAQPVTKLDPQPMDVDSFSKPDDFVSSIDKIAQERAEAQDKAQPVQGDLFKPVHISKAEQELQRRLMSQFMKETVSHLSNQHYDGVSESDSDSELEQETSAEIRRQRAKELDIESDDEYNPPNEQDAHRFGDDLEDEKEEDQFLEFARNMLGITVEQYNQILNDRKQRGAYVPKPSTPPKKEETKRNTDPTSLSFTSSVNPTKPSEEPSKPPFLDPFDSVMNEMDRQLVIATSQSSSIPIPASLSAEEELLSSLLSSSHPDLPSSLLTHLDHTDSDSKANLLENLLQSFKAQNGYPGPVETLLRRLGIGSLPMDSSDENMNQD